MSYPANSNASKRGATLSSKPMRSVAVLATSALYLTLQASPVAADTAGVPEITDFWLIDAATDTRLFKLSNFQTINLAFVPGQLSIEAVADGDTQSVSFTVDGIAAPLHNSAPYAIGSDTNGDFEPVPSLLESGWVRIRATPHAGPNGSNTAGATVERRLFKLKTNFVVNSTADLNDAQPGDGKCEALELTRPYNTVISARSAKTSKFNLSRDRFTFVPTRPVFPGIPPVIGVRKTCTLRAAIEEANIQPGLQSISIDGASGQVYKLARGELSITDGLVIYGNDQPIIDAEQRSRVLNMTGPEGGSISVTLNALDLANGNVGAFDRGGVVYVQRATVQINNSIIRGGTGNFGGGIYLQDGGNATLTATIVKDNKAGTPESFGGGGATQRGGGIFNLGGIVKIRNSAIVDNIAVRGGGVSNYGGQMRIENSSVLDNEARSLGGGIENRHNMDDKGRLHISFSTITGNRAATSLNDPANARTGGGIHNAGWAYMASSILAGNIEEYGAGNALSGPDCYSPTQYDFKSYRNNIVGVINNNCSFGDYSWGNSLGIQSGTDLEPLNPKLSNRYWSPIPNRVPLSTSPAVDQGGGAGAIYPCPLQDSRGQPRPAGASCDIGAVERQ